MPSPADRKDPEMLAERLQAGDRRALAKAITLVESARPDDRLLASELVQRLDEPASVAMRIGLSGTPGVGKSTFIEAFGMQLAEQGRRIAVLAVDPSSARSGGSILGDKTRMEQLARSPHAFIRPSPSEGTLGGVARRTRETIRLVEAAGFDTIIVETVGVGQSETAVAEMTDLFLLLLAPAGGDELQGVKRGIMEIADLIVINKADGALKPVAETTRTEYAGALRLMRRRPDDPQDFPMSLTVSAMTGAGLPELWESITRLFTWRFDHGAISRMRAAQAITAFDRALEQAILAAVRQDPVLTDRLAALHASVAAGEIDPDLAARQLVGQFLEARSQRT
ncbi:MAG: methylmalonyl Co-A mutase-associated GTPase MeaB [Pseudomonadota bacterium]